MQSKLVHTFKTYENKMQSKLIHPLKTYYDADRRTDSTHVILLSSKFNILQIACVTKNYACGTHHKFHTRKVFRLYVSFGGYEG